MILQSFKHWLSDLETAMEVVLSDKNAYKCW